MKQQSLLDNQQRHKSKQGWPFLSAKSTVALQLPRERPKDKEKSKKKDEKQNKRDRESLLREKLPKIESLLRRKPSKIGLLLH